MVVAVYYNLHKKCYSIQHKGLVIAHMSEVFLKEVKFKVSAAGRERVRREKRKNVHAKVHGILVDKPEVIDYLEGKRVRYNPYRDEHFNFAETGEEVFEAGFAHLSTKREIFI